MARHKQDGLLYFPFDTDFFYADKRIKRLHAKFGNDGLVFYIYLLTEIYRNGYYISWDEDTADDIAADLRLKEGFIEQVMTYLRGRSLLIESILSTGVTIITSPGIQKRYQEAVKSRKRDVHVDSEIWILSKEETATYIKVTGNENKSCGNENKSCGNENKSCGNDTKESKGKESKIKEISNTAQCYAEDAETEYSEVQIPLNDGSFYRVPLKMITEWKNAFPAVDIECQLKKMIAWCNANPKRRKTRRGIERFIVNWLSGDQDRGGRYYHKQGSKNSFNNFEQNQYDFEELERQLLSEN